MKITIVRLQVRLEVDASYDVEELIDSASIEMDYDFKFEDAIVNTEIQVMDVIDQEQS